MNKQITGWAMPLGSSVYHFFTEEHSNVMLRSACTAFYSTPWFIARETPLVQRELHQEGNCLGCRAWLAIPRNRRALEAEHV